MIAFGVTDLRKSAILRKSPASPASGSSIAASASFSEQPSSSSQHPRLPLAVGVGLRLADRSHRDLQPLRRQLLLAALNLLQQLAAHKARADHADRNLLELAHLDHRRVPRRRATPQRKLAGERRELERGEAEHVGGAGFGGNASEIVEVQIRPTRTRDVLPRVDSDSSCPQAVRRMPRALVRVVGSDSGALSLTAVQAAVTKKTKAASAFAASFATASFEEVERTEGVARSSTRTPRQVPCVGGVADNQASGEASARARRRRRGTRCGWRRWAAAAATWPPFSRRRVRCRRTGTVE